jgi:hypothetical protein
VCVCSKPHGSKLCDEERIEIARNISTIRVPEAYAMSGEVRAGRDDANLTKRKRELQKEARGDTTPERDTSLCPDCHGQNFFYPDGDRQKGVKKCDHLRLDEELEKLERDYKQAQDEMRRAS